MKRGKKLLLLTLVLVVVAGAALAALKFMPDEEVEETESISVLTLDAESITGLAWSYGDESLSFVCDGSVWSYSEDADFPLDTSYMSAMTSAVSDISAEKVIEEVSDLAEYGLDEPVCSITVTAEAETTIDIGDETSLDGLRYVSIGDGNVYLVSSDLLTNFSYGLYDLVAKETLPDMSEFVSFSVERASGTLVIDYLEGSDLAYTDRYTYFAEDGDGWLSLDSELAENFVSQITGLTWGDCVDYKADLKTLGNYGLDSPAVTVTVNYIETTEVETNETDEDGEPVTETREEEKSLTLELGSYAEEGCYARLAGSGMVYLIDASICDSLLYTLADELLPEEILLLDWDGMSGFEIELDGETIAVEMSYSEDDYDYLYTLDGEDADFDDVLDQVEALPSSGSAEGASLELGELISLIFHAEGYEDVVLRIYSYDSGSCVATINGEDPRFTDRTAVQSLVDSVNAALSAMEDGSTDDVEAE